MKELIRNCQHYGSHHTFLLRGRDGNVVGVEKKTFSETGIRDLDREAEGLEWYCRLIGRDASEMIGSFEKAAGYGRLEIKYHDGAVITTPASPDLVKGKLRAAVEHYLEVFGRDSFRFSHGDYFLGNIVYTGDRVAWVIDWEHFNDKLPAGYDALNCVTQVFLSAHGKKRRYSRESVESARALIAKISERAALPEEAISSPALWCRNTAAERSDVWGGQHGKLPHLDYPRETCAEVDRIIGVMNGGGI